MFGLLVFGLNPFATVRSEGIVIGIVWENQCTADSTWNAQDKNVSPWTDELVASTQWENQRASNISTQECK